MSVCKIFISHEFQKKQRSRRIENTPMQGSQNVNQMQELFQVELQRITGVHYERWFSFFEVLINSRVIKFEI